MPTLAQYAASLAQAAANYQSQMFEPFVEKKATEILKNIITTTPIDTGLLVKTWNDGSSYVDYNGTSATMYFINAAVSPRGGALYGSFVEEGHHMPSGRWWEGYHFVRKALDTGSKDVAKAHSSELVKYLRGYGIG